MGCANIEGVTLLMHKPRNHARLEELSDSPRERRGFIHRKYHFISGTQDLSGGPT